VTLLDRVHGGMVHTRRIRVLVDHIAPQLPAGASVLDIGSGDGKLAALLRAQRPDISVRGVDVLVRDSAAIPTDRFDGLTIDHPDGAFDVALLIDVLHHADDPLALLREAFRVARRVIIKDHTRDGILAEPTLRFMDRVGNVRYGVSLPYNYWSRVEWDAAFSDLRVRPIAMTRRLGLYPAPASWVFDRALHFVAVLVPSAGQA
jgi:SAM-dependent methyltransferase